MKTRINSLLLGTLLLIAAGLRYSTGKIDHDILLLILPIFLAQSWGGVGINKEKSKLPNLGLLGFACFLYFATSSVSKAFSGWFSLQSTSLQSWTETYFTFYQVDPWLPIPFVSQIASMPLSSILVVMFEFAVSLLFLFGRYRAALISLCLFHALIVLSLGINFSKSILVYACFITIKSKRSTNLIASALVLAIIGIPSSILETDRSINGVWLCILFASLVYISSSRNQVLRSNSLVKIIFLLVTIPSVFSYEMYPSMTGPSFHGFGFEDYLQNFESSGIVVQPTDVFRTNPGYAQNLAITHANLHPQAGHTFNNFREPAPLPEGVKVSWVRK